jgi:hypothetical protein
MKTPRWFLSLVLLTAVFRSGAQAAAPGDPAAARPGFDLQRLTPLSEGKLSTAECARLYLAFLQEEISQPSPASTGLGGGPITHDYILAQIVLAGAEAKADEAVLQQAAATAPAGEYRDALQLTLGLLENRRTVLFLVDYLANTRNSPWLRERAARALTRIPEPRAIPALAAALKDPFWVGSGCVGPRQKHYPVRAVARLALLNLKQSAVTLPQEVQQALDRVIVSEPLR